MKKESTYYFFAVGVLNLIFAFAIPSLLRVFKEILRDTLGYEYVPCLTRQVLGLSWLPYLCLALSLLGLVLSLARPQLSPVRLRAAAFAILLVDALFMFLLITVGILLPLITPAGEM